jgi:hypothetical protein
VGTDLARAGAQAEVGPRSTVAGRLLDDLLAAPRQLRTDCLAELDPADLAALLGESLRQHGTAFRIWAGDPVGFVTEVLGETLWSKQIAVLEALTTYQQVAVPAGFGLGKTFLGARAVSYFVCTQPVGVALSVTIATRFRQVQRQLWPHIRRLAARAELPGRVDMTQWVMPDTNGVSTTVSYGFSLPSEDEAAFQGIHASSLLLVVDEAGGIAPAVGQGTRNLLTGDATMLAIGNPATDEERSWFETLCEAGTDPDRPRVTTIQISARDSPLITGENAGVCRDCPPQMASHSLATHLVDQDWIEETIREHGADAPYVIAKVEARFPTGGSRRAIPTSLVQAAYEQPDPVGEDYVWLPELGLPEQRAQVLYRMGAWVRLGVDVAADGGDEFVIARQVGDLPTIEHYSSGAVNEDALAVAGEVLRHILRAQQLAAALGSTLPVRVKIDGIGLGWGVQSVLKAWGKELRHSAQIVSVIVSEKPDREPDAMALRPLNKRAEMYLAYRNALAVDGAGVPGLRLHALDDRTRAQMSGPRLLTNSAGQSYIEAKKDMRSRGMRSPDRGEAGILANYEPLPPKRKGRILAG